MGFGRFALLPGIAAALLAFACGWQVLAAPADRYEMRFEIFGIGGLHLLTNRTMVETSPARYAIAIDLNTRGLASVFVDLVSHSEVHGRLTGDSAVPETYQGETRRNGAARASRLDYGPDGTVLNASNTPAVPRATLAATDGVRGTVDQLTAYFQLERQLARRNTCARMIPVFDGRRRYNLHFSDAPAEVLEAETRHRFSGPTRVCEMSREEVAGYAAGESGEGAYRGKIWYAQLIQGGVWVPVRMEFDTEFGLVTGYLAELHGRGIDLRLME